MILTRTLEPWQTKVSILCPQELSVVLNKFCIG